MIPYSVAAIVLPIICALADRYMMRAIPMVFCYVCCAAGLILLLITESQAPRIVGTCLVSAGSYTGVILGATWVMTTHGGYTKRSSAWAMCQVFIQCYSILGTKIYDVPPRFLKGHGIVLGLQTLACAAILLKWWIMWAENRRKDKVQEEAGRKGETVTGVEKSIEELNDKHPHFRYLL